MLLAMLRTACALVAAATVAACGPPPPNAFTRDAPPAQWTAEQRQVAVDTHPFGWYGICVIAQDNFGPKLTEADKRVVAEILHRKGYTARDVELITDGSVVYGTGMTYRGLECAGGGRLFPNRAFYPGTGHQWQVPFGSGFVYLEGDGTPEGMRVTAWN
jgi:hypothetical protein